jgi:hypothetical protein
MPVWKDSGGTKRESLIALKRAFFFPDSYAKSTWKMNSGTNEKKFVIWTMGLEKPTTHLT